MLLAPQSTCPNGSQLREKKGLYLIRKRRAELPIACKATSYIYLGTLKSKTNIWTTIFHAWVNQHQQPVQDPLAQLLETIHAKYSFRMRYCRSSYGGIHGNHPLGRLSNRLDEGRCPYSDLCPDPGLLNSNMSSKNHYIAFPAGQLAFISSLSSTISFSLVGILMIIYVYSTVSELLIDEKDKAGRPSLPSPYQFSIIVRLLNAEVLALWEVV